MAVINVPDIEGPIAQLCWKQAPDMVRCDRKKGHAGPHSWQRLADAAQGGVHIQDGALAYNDVPVVEEHVSVTLDFFLDPSENTPEQEARRIAALKR